MAPVIQVYPYLKMAVLLFCGIGIGLVINPTIDTHDINKKIAEPKVSPPVTEKENILASTPAIIEKPQAKS